MKIAKWLCSFFALVTILNIFGCVSAQGQTSVPNPSNSSVGTENVMRQPTDSKTKPRLPSLSTALDQLYTDWQLTPEQAVAQARKQGIEINSDLVKVMLIMADDTSADAAVLAIPTLGGQVTVRYQTWIDAWVPIKSLGRIATLPGVSQVREPIPVMPLTPPKGDTSK